VRLTCNPGIGDADGDGLDEIAIPVIQGEEDHLSLYQGDGTEAWRNDDVRFYHSYYGDTSTRIAGAHWHYACSHRHLFTRIFDVDGDGVPEVVCGDGPLYVLDARTGAIKKTIDLQAHVQVWCPAKLFGVDQPSGIVCGIEKIDGSGSSVCAIDNSLDVAWDMPIQGKTFYDAIWAGDVDEDGYDEIIFSPDSEQRMFLMDRHGQIRWSLSIPDRIGDDTHVDYLVIDAILPEGGKQIAMATGPALIDKDGNVRWTLGKRHDHAQFVVPVDWPPDRAGKSVYFCESFAMKAHMVDCNGEPLWTTDRFQRIGPDVAGIHLRLPSNGGLAHWSGADTQEIVQPQLLAYSDRSPRLAGRPRLYTVLFSLDGRVVAHLPYEAEVRPNHYCGAMCSLPARTSHHQIDDIVMVTHNTGELLIYSNPRARSAQTKGPRRST